jgi:hypothetical protein
VDHAHLVRVIQSLRRLHAPLGNPTIERGRPGGTLG